MKNKKQKSDESQPPPMSGSQKPDRLYLVTVEVTIPIGASDDRTAEAAAIEAVKRLPSIDSLRGCVGVSVVADRVVDEIDLGPYADAPPWNLPEDSPQTCRKIWAKDVERSGAPEKK